MNNFPAEKRTFI